MAKKKQPYIPIYTGDYLKDTRALSLEAKGAWMDLILFIWINGKAGVIEGTMEEFARMVGASEMKFVAVLNELCRKDICDIFGDQTKVFKIVCRRLAKEAEISEKRSEAVQTRYKNPTNTPTKPIQNTDSDNDNEIENGNPIRKEPVSISADTTLEIVPQGTIIEEKLSRLDELYLDEQRIKWPHVDFDFEVRAFFEKVRGSPLQYVDHRDLRLAFQAQLRNAKKIQPNGKSTGNNRKQQHTAGLAASVAETYRGVFTGGKDGPGSEPAADNH